MSDKDPGTDGPNTEHLDHLCKFHTEVWDLMNKWMRTQKTKPVPIQETLRVKESGPAACRADIAVIERTADEPTASETTHDLFMKKLKQAVDETSFESFCKRYRDRLSQITKN